MLPPHELIPGNTGFPGDHGVSASAETGTRPKSDQKKDKAVGQSRAPAATKKRARANKKGGGKSSKVSCDTDSDEAVEEVVDLPADAEGLASGSVPNAGGEGDEDWMIIGEGGQVPISRGPAPPQEGNPSALDVLRWQTPGGAAGVGTAPSQGGGVVMTEAAPAGCEIRSSNAYMLLYRQTGWSGETGLQPPQGEELGRLPAPALFRVEKARQEWREAKEAFDKRRSELHQKTEERREVRDGSQCLGAKRGVVWDESQCFICHLISSHPLDIVRSMNRVIYGLSASLHNPLVWTPPPRTTFRLYGTSWRPLQSPRTPLIGDGFHLCGSSHGPTMTVTLRPWTTHR